MDESVGDGASGVVEELSPIFEGQVGGDDGGGSLVALVEDLVEQVGAAGVEGEVSELVESRRERVLRACEATNSLTKSAARVNRTR
jgi:hypothetical protein